MSLKYLILQITKHISREQRVVDMTVIFDT